MKYNEFFKRTTAMVMSLVMTVSMLPLSALAQDTPHTHSDDCYEAYLTCGVEEGAVHTHDDSCYTVENHTVCGLVETEGHTHTDACYQTEDVLVCKQEVTEGHTHSDGCYDEQEELTCGQAEKDAHAHGEGCYASEEVLKCTQQVEPHTHEEKCWKEDSELICKKSTEPHVHTDECYGKKLICEFADADHDDKTGDPEQGSGADVYTVMSGKISALPPVDAVAEMTDEEKQALVETLSALREELDALLDEEAITMEQYESLALPMMNLNAAVIGDTIGKNTENLSNLPGYVGDVHANESCLHHLELFATKKDSTQVKIEEGVQLDGDEKITLGGQFHVNRAELIAQGGVFKYRLPAYVDIEYHTSMTVTSDEDPSKSTTIRLNIADGVATFTLDEGWESVLNNTWITGSFTAVGELDASGFQGGSNTITLGETKISVTLPENIKGKFSNIHVEKEAGELYQPGMPGYALTGTEFNGKSYIAYTVTVTNQDAEPVNLVRVEDSITNEGKCNDKAVSGAPVHPNGFIERYFDCFAGITDTEQSVSDVSTVDADQGKVYLTPDKANSFTWDVGTLEANAVKTLTYYVLVKDAYVGFKHGTNDADNGVFKNTADLYSGEYPRDEDKAIYTPPVPEMEVQKRADDPVFDSKTHKYTIKYHVTVTAPATNPYTMTNVKVNDELQEATGIDVYQLSYIRSQGTVKLYDSAKEDHEIPLPTPDELPYRNANPTGGARSMTVLIGDMAPGDVRVLTYTVEVPKNVFLQSNLGQVNLKNKAQIYDDEVKNPAQYGSLLKETIVESALNLKHWAGKLKGLPQNSPVTVTMDSTDACYAPDGTSLANPGSFTVQPQNVKYSVVVNQTADWDVSRAAFHDQLTYTTSTPSMLYAGWVRVNAYKITDSTSLSGTVGDSDAYETLRGMTPQKTVWVNVHDLQEFSFTPQSIGLTEKDFAYTLDYYTYTPNSDFTTASVTNTFKLVGKVGPGNGNADDYGTITWPGASQDITINGSAVFGYSKQDWYYDNAREGTFTGGQLYWAITANSNTGTESGKILKDTRIKDAPNVSGTNKAHAIIPGQSVVGVYRAARVGSFAAAYADLAAFQAAAQPLDSSLYNVTYDSGAAIVQFTQDIQIADSEDIIIIVKTNPTVLPNGTESVMNYANKAFAAPGTLKNFDNGIQATQPIHSGYNLAKAANALFSVSNSKVNIISGVLDDIAPYSYQDGVYASWLITLSKMTAGKYSVEDVLPDGVELVYVRRFSGDAVTEASTSPIGDVVTSVFGADSVTYSVDGNRIQLYFPHLTGGQTASYQYQVVARVTDPSILLGGQEKDLLNTSALFPGDTVEEDYRLTIASAPVHISMQTLSKNSTHQDTDGAMFPFSVVLNPDAVDLNPGGDSLTLVDEMGKSLMFALDSLKVMHGAQELNLGTEVTPTTYTVRFETSESDKNVLRITVPDGMKLDIAYKCIVNAVPGEPVSFSNTAYWEGYAENVSVVEMKNFVVRGSVSLNKDAEIRVIKVDGSLQRLSGAEFKLYKLEQSLITVKNDGKITSGQIRVISTELPKDPAAIGSTLADGEIRFQGAHVDYNTVYALVESKAPDGFVKDSTPHYVVILRDITGSAANPVFPTIAGAALPGLSRESASNVITYNAVNYKGSVTITKDFKQADGSAKAPVAGSYTFGIWEYEDALTPEGNPKDTQIITWAEGETQSEKSVTFTDLDAQKKYVVYELDDNNAPILPNTMASVDGALYKVTYSQNVVASFDTPQAIRVSNTEPARTSITINASKTLNGVPTGGYTIGVYDANGNADRSGIDAAPKYKVDGAEIARTTFDTNGAASIDLANVLTFVKPGTYRYQLKEINDGKPGVTYDTTPRTLTVKVTQNGDTLTPVTEVNGAPADTIAFVNTYAASGTAHITATKVLTGREWNDSDSFAFELLDASGVVKGTGNATKDNRVLDFGEISYTLADLDGAVEKVFTYTIRETGTYDGITKASDCTVNVKVSDAEKNGVLAVSYAVPNGSGESVYHENLEPIQLDNVYVPTSAQAVIQAKKAIMNADGTAELEDWKHDSNDWSSYSFYFRLQGSDGAPMPAEADAAAKVDNKTATWGTITFNAPGEYWYAICELTGPDDNLVPVTPENTANSTQKLLYDEAEHRVKVVVTDDQHGELSAQVVYEDNDIPVFRNEEMPDAYAQIGAVKQKTGGALQNGEFIFGLYSSDATGAYNPALDHVQNATLHTLTQTTGSVSFTAIPFNAANYPDYKLPHVEYYVIHEENNNTHVENKTGDVLVTVTVNKATTGNKLDVQVAYSALNGGTLTLADNGTPVIVNEYTSAGTAQLSVTKSIVGRNLWKEGETFTFELTPVGTAPMHIAEGEAASKTVTSEANTAVFPILSFTQDDMNYQTSVDYTYKIHEVRPELPEGTPDTPINRNGMTYAEDALVTIRLTDDGQGNITAQYRPAGSTDFTGEPVNVLFENRYETEPVTKALKVTKQLKGRDWVSSDRFTFNLTPIRNTAGLDVSEQPMPTPSSVDVTSTSADYTAAFNNITFTKPGVYQYEITEVSPAVPIPGVTYSNVHIGVEVTVTDNLDGTMTASAVYAADSNAQSAVFTNSYVPTPVSVDIQGQKKVKNHPLKAGEYTFSLYETDGTSFTDPTFTVSDTAAPIFQGAAGAAGAIGPHTIHYTKPGTHYYVMKENIPAGIVANAAGDYIRNGVTFDTHLTRIKVEVSDNTATGKLVVKTTYKNLDAPEAEDRNVTDKAAFTNVYKAEGKAELKVTKQITDQAGVTTEKGWTFQTNYDFSLTPVDGAPLRIKDTAGKIVPVAEGKLTTTARHDCREASFDTLWFTEADIGHVYNYTLREVKPAGTNETNNVHNSITYSDTVIPVTIRVLDAGNGILQILYSYNGQTSATIRNLFEQVEVSGTKTWTDSGKTHDNAHEITLELYRTSQNPAVVSGEEAVPISAEEYANLWSGNHYVFRNLAKYDASGFEYRYTVKEIRVPGYYEGVISTPADAVGFVKNITNEAYTANGSVTLTATKVLSGDRIKGIRAEEFSFVVRDAEGKTVSTGKNAADGTISFEPIVYTQAALGENLAPKTYTYTVSEVTGTDESITYSAEIYKVSVTVAPATFDSTHADAHKLTCTVTVTDSANAAADAMVFHNVFNSGSLKIAKTVFGDLASTIKEFTFKVTLSCDGEYPYTGSKTGIITSGGTVKLKHGESITITNLPAGATYTVEESDNAGYVVNATNDKGTILKDWTVLASFVNSKSSVPKTGDQSNFIQWVTAMVACLIGAAAALFFLLKRRSRYHN